MFARHSLSDHRFQGQATLKINSRRLKMPGAQTVTHPLGYGPWPSSPYGVLVAKSYAGAKHPNPCQEFILVAAIVRLTSSGD